MTPARTARSTASVNGTASLRDGTYLIGRTRRRSGVTGCFVIDNPTVSERHAELIVLNGTCHLSDLDSHNGTWRVRAGGDRRISAGYVRPDERLRFGVVECSLEELFSGRELAEG